VLRGRDALQGREEVMGRTAEIDPAQARAAKGEFKLANERGRDDDGITELPIPWRLVARSIDLAGSP
jgi:hypothetical protein